MHPIFTRFLLLLSYLFFVGGLESRAQAVGTDIFLKGNSAEVGIGTVGAFGTTNNAPTGYHPRSVGYAMRLGFVSDPAMDGWAVGTPNYIGDYFLPGSPHEGWDMMHSGTTWNRAWQNGSGGTFTTGLGALTLTGANTGYEVDGTIKRGIWEGNMGNLSIKQVTELDSTKLYFIMTVTIKNTGTTAINNIYYNRTVDPDQEVGPGGGYTTNNEIVYQPTGTEVGEQRALVSAIGPNWPSLSYLGLGTKDCRARVYIMNFSLTSTRPDNMYNGIGGGMITAGSTSFSDVGIGIVFNIGTLAAGDSTELRYAYILSADHLDSAFAEMETSLDIAGEPFANGDTLFSCEGETLDVDIVNGGGYTWGTWSPSAGVSPTSGPSVSITVGDEPTWYTVIGEGSNCLTDTISLYIVPVQDTTVVYDTSCASTPYYFLGDYLFTDGVYYNSSISSIGCDSVVELHLTFMPEITEVFIDSICFEEMPYWWNGIPVFDTAAEVTFSGTSIHGCDSLVTLDLRIKPSYSETEIVEICESDLPYTWMGYTVTTGGVGVATHNDTTILGCDSITTLNLIVHPNATTVEDITICDTELPYTWNGITVSAGGMGVATFTTSTSLACDSVVSLNLHVNPSYDILISETICAGSSYVFDGDTLTTTGTYVGTYTTMDGCDSNVTLELMVTPADTFELSETICSGTSYDFFGTLHNSSGIYYHTSTGACDTIWQLTLTVNDTIRSSSTDTICEGGALAWGGTLYTSAGVYDLYGSNAAGCDTLHTLTVVVTPADTFEITETICSGASYDFFGTLHSSSGTFYHTSSGTCDTIWQLTLTVNDTIRSSSTETICEGDVLHWGGVDYTSAGVYDLYGSNALGCDTLHTLTVVVTPVDTVLISTEICSGSTYDFYGTIISTSGTYYHTSSSMGACDTVWQLVVDFTDTPITYLTETICPGGSYVIGDSTFTAEGEYSLPGVNAEGCDTVLVLTIEYAPADSVAISESICSGSAYDFFGTLHSDAGTYYHLASGAGVCDTVWVLTLDITDTIRTDQTETICSGGSFVWEGVTYTTAGEYPLHGVNASGCDTLHTLTIVVNPIDSVAISESICSGSTYDFFGTLYSDAGTYYHLASSAGVCDTVWVLTLDITDTIRTDQTETICSGGSFVWEGVTYTTAGEYPLHGVNVSGCDTLHTLTIVVNPTDSVTISESICSGSTYDFFGTLYSDAGTYYHLASGADVCDTVWVLTLDITDTIRTDQTDTICSGGSFVWEGVTYTTAGEYPLHGVNASGCDTLHTLTIVVNPTDSVTISESICSGSTYDFFGTLYSDAGTYYHLASGADVCDTVWVLTLDITDTIRTDQTETICSGGSFVWEGVTYTTAGEYPLHGVNASGCDTLHTLTIIVSPIVTDTINETICSGNTYTFYGTDYSLAGTYSHTETSGSCDTVFVLNLEVTDTIRTNDTSTICYGGSIVWGGVSYTSEGTYYLSGVNALGCDTLHTLVIEVGPVITDTIAETICSGGSYDFYGTMYNTPGTYSHTSTGGDCDTVFVLNLSVTDTIRTYDEATLCAGGSITVGTTVITDAGVYPLYFSSTAGCDSLYILTVTVDEMPTDTTVATICNDVVYPFYGTEYSESGIYTYLDESGMCDTLRVLDLSVNPTMSSTLAVTFCRNQLPVTVLGIDIPVSATTNPAFDSVVFVTDLGCDSTVVIDLTISDTSWTDIDTMLCYGVVINFGDIAISEPGIYTRTLSNSAGCDSIVSLEVAYSAPPIIQDTFVTGCGSVTFDGVEYLDDVVLYDTFFNYMGCDSFIRTAAIYVLYEPRDTFYVEICQGESYDFNGDIYTTSTTATQTYLYHNGCDSLITMVLTVHALPDVRLDFTAVDSTSDILCTLDTIRLWANGANEYMYFNEFNEYLGEGEYVEVILANRQNRFYAVGFNEYGCTDTTQITIFAEPCCEVLMPNAFSPNGDGLNDLFGPVTYGNPENYRFEVYNRWGERVFVSFNIDVKWNGYYDNGRQADPGTYFYTVTGTCYDGTPLRLKGDVTLIR